MKGRYPQLEEREWEWLYSCAVRAAFAGEKIQKQDYEKMWMLYHKFRKAMLIELQGIKKWWFLLVKGM